MLTEVLVGGIFSIFSEYKRNFNFTEYPKKRRILTINFEKHQQLLTLIFAIHEINKDPRLLPNTTLYSDICDTSLDAWRTYKAILSLLSTERRNVVNYYCEWEKKVLSVIGGLTEETSSQLATITSVYKIPQISYGMSASILSGKIDFPTLYRMAPKESTYYVGLVRLLLHFKWTWVGIVSDDVEESFLQKLQPLLDQNSICVVFMETINKYNGLQHDATDQIYLFSKLNEKLLLTEANIIILNGEPWFQKYLSYALHVFEQNTMEYIQKVWIVPPDWNFNVYPTGQVLGQNIFYGALSLSVQRKVVPAFKAFHHTFNPDKTILDFGKFYWDDIFSCYSLNEPEIQTENHRGEGKTEDIYETDMTGESYNIYNAVYAVANALHVMYTYREKGRLHKSTSQHLNVQPWQLHFFLKNIHFNNGAEQEIFFEKRHLLTGYDIISHFCSNNGSSLVKKKVGNFFPSEEFTIRDDLIVWNRRLKQTPPLSKCVESCHLGYRKRDREGEAVCCYDCISCSEAMISNHTDAVHCDPCPEDQYPNKNHDQCIPKVTSFLSYQEPMGIIMAALAIFCAVITSLVMQTFLKNWNTPIVKANNRNLTCVLLGSILLCYFSSLLFIGKPWKMTCLLRQPVFGIIFSVAVSCVLAKTIMVVLIFMASKPGSKLRKYLGQKVANSIVLSCSFIQVGFCIVWLSSYPPFPDADMHSEIGKIILKCNEGSLIMFYCVLGYLGILAIISFTIAFLARKLPDTFNEAKFITFSMLIFCSVWLSFLPAYLSTKGKTIVTVEVFAILASNTGLLVCIFFPKCYTIILRSDLNTKALLREKRSL